MMQGVQDPLHLQGRIHLKGGTYLLFTLALAHTPVFVFGLCGLTVQKELVFLCLL